jgi:Mg-chelatase subunit ChlI
MPVIANQKKPDHLYCPPDALHPASLHHGLAYHPAQLNGNTLRRTLEEYRAHHQACAVRRRNGLEYELRVEAQRTEWLTRKFMDGVRQQQQQQSQSSSGATTSATGSGAAQGKTEQRSAGSEGTTGGGAANGGGGTTASSATEVSM